MEVQKHPHDVMHKKKWSEYLLEFLMIFLAVFLGFVAENLREEAGEHRREKGFMHSLVQDLQSDTLDIQRNIDLGVVQSKKMDTLIDLINNGMAGTSIMQLYRLNFESGRVMQASFEDRTSSQLKNSGGMRLIRNEKIADSIRTYWGKIKNLDDISARLADIQGKIADIAAQLFNDKYYSKRDPMNPIGGANSVNPSAQLIINDPKLLAQYANRKYSRLGVLYNYIIQLKHAKVSATNLLGLIKEDYHLK
jgi:hypothetical protein